MFSPSIESRLLALISEGNKLDLWNISTRRRIYTDDIDIEDRRIYDGAIAFSPDGVLVATVAALVTGVHRYPTPCDTMLCIWTVKTGRLKTSFSHTFDSPVKSIKFAPDANSLAFISHKTIAIYDTESNNIFHQESLPYGFDYSVDWRTHTDSRDDMKMDNQGVTFTAVIRKTRILHNYGYATFFPNGKAVAYVVGTTIHIDDVTNGTDDIQSSDLNISRISILNNDDALIERQSQYEIWNLEKPEVKRRYLAGTDSLSHTISPDGKTLVAWRERPGNYCLFWNIATDERTRRFEDVRVCGAKFSPDGEFLALTIEGGILQILEATSWRERVRFDTGNDDLGVVQFLSHNKVILWTPQSQRYLCLGDIETGQCFSRTERHYDKLSISPDRMMVAFSTLQEKKHAYLLQTDTGNIKAELFPEKTLPFMLLLMSFSPDNSRVATLTDGWMINIHDTATGENIMALEVDFPFSLSGNIAISSDGKVAVGTSESGVLVWDPLVDKWSSPSSQPICWHNDLSFSQDNKYLEGLGGRIPISPSVKDYNCLFVSDDWVLQGGERLLWLPPAYRKSLRLSPVKGGVIVINNTDTSAAIIKVDLEKTPLVKNRS